MIQLITITKEDLKELLKNSILEALNESEKNQSPIEKELCYLTREETSKKLHLSLTTLDTYTKKGFINAVKIGHRVLYKESDINDSLFSKIKSIKYKN